LFEKWNATANKPVQRAGLSWSMVTTGDREQAVRLRQDNGTTRRIELSANHFVTAKALSLVRGRPLLAVASLGGGEVLLEIYDVRSGRKLRRCTAHTLPIRSLSFSRDSRLLASAGDDRFACVWSLTELDATLSERGMPPIVVGQREGQPAVTNLQTADRQLATGDRLLGQLTSQGIERWETAADVYRSFWSAEPGMNVDIRRDREGQIADVSVPVIHRVDDVGPLFSLFLLEPAPPRRARWSWIG
jgi:hypothetical protein